MRVKSYYANTIREAISRARKELGSDAMIIASRKTTGEQQKLGDYEVVCGSTSEQPQAAADNAPRERKNSSSPNKHRELPDLNAILAPHGFTDDVVKEIQAGVLQGIKRKVTPMAALATELKRLVPVSPEVGRPNCDRQIVALVGPPGAGKTTTTVKLAIRFGLAQGKAVHIISMDGYRVGGTAALRAYAAGMGVTFDGLDNVDKLSQILDLHHGRKLILIDTAGLGPDNHVASAPLASLLSRHPEIDTHLVMPAYMAPLDMNATFTRFRPFLPGKLLFTGSDMASSVGPMLAQAARTERPISFLGTGQEIPEDLEPADAARLVSRFLPAQKAAAAASAA